jgi:hypothetical protein
MSANLRRDTSYNVSDSLPDEIIILAQDELDLACGFYFREWTSPDRQCFRWSGVTDRIRIPIRVQRSSGNTIYVKLMNEMCSPSNIGVIVDGQGADIRESFIDASKIITATIPPSSRSGLLLEIESAMQVEGAHDGARMLGIAIIDIRITSGGDRL